MKSASFLRRMAAMTYDSFLILACIIFSTLIWVVVRNEAVTPSSLIAFRVYLCVIIYLFFVWFWVKRGKTLGMLAWKTKLVDVHGESIGILRASVRIVLAALFSIPFGFTYIWMLLDPDSLALHDRISKTYIVLDS